MSALIINGELGLSGVVDQTSTSYDLLQDEVAGQGNYAFHLATQNGDWFRLSPTISVTSGCRLFFLSRLGWATTSQVATVQVSTNSGASWSDTIWSQAGTNGSGETASPFKPSISMPTSAKIFKFVLSILLTEGVFFLK